MVLRIQDVADLALLVSLNNFPQILTVSFFFRVYIIKFDSVQHHDITDIAVHQYSSFIY